jgi:Fur family transcriptional regulator, ferric uptake regulator
METTPTDVRIRDQLSERGVRDTAPRRAVVDAAVRRRGRFTANDIVEELASRHVGRATVFRTLDLLVELGILARLHSDSHHAYTVCGAEHHHHLVCVGCDSVEEIVSESAERLVHQIALDAGFQPQGHLLEIEGLCQACQRAAGLSREAN